MTTKERNELARLNAVVNSIDRIIDYGLQKMKQTTTDDLKLLREHVHRRRLEIINKRENR